MGRAASLIVRAAALAALVLALPAAAQVDAAREAQRRGVELHRAGDFMGALLEFDKVVQLAPEAPLGWYNRGLVRRDLRQCRPAIADFGRALELEPGLFNAAYQRANCRQALGEYEAAIADYSLAANMPGQHRARFLAYFGRGDAQRRLGRLEQALADYNTVLGLRTDTTAQRSRGWVHAYLGRWREAHEDMAAYLHGTEGKEPDAAYALIVGTLALQRLGRHDPARKFLAEWSPRVNTLAWPAPVIAYLKGDLGEPALLAAAGNSAERTEALAYLGLHLQVTGQHDRGVALLRTVLREGEPAYLEYDLAFYELRRAGLAMPSERRERSGQ